MTATPMVAPVVTLPEGFLAATKTARAAMISGLSASAMEAMLSGHIESATELAQQVVVCNDHLNDPRATHATYVPTPAEQVARRIATLRMSADLLETGAYRPEGIDDNYADDDNWTETVRMAHPIPERAVVMASAKVASGVRGPNRNDISGLIRSAFNGLPVGTVLTVPQILDATDAPRDFNGRVSARLDAPKGCTVPGITGSRNEDGDLVAVNTVEVSD